MTEINGYLKRIRTWQTFLQCLELCAVEFASSEPDEEYLDSGIRAIIEDVENYQNEHGESVSNVFCLKQHGLGKLVEIKLEVAVKPIPVEDM